MNSVHGGNNFTVENRISRPKYLLNFVVDNPKIVYSTSPNKYDRGVIRFGMALFKHF